MGAAITDLVEGAMGSPWIYLALCAFSMIDGFLPARAEREPRRERRRLRGHRLLADRGGTILIVCRYIPGARTAITLTAGATRYSLRSFSIFDGAAALSWGAYSALVGYIGGAAFEDAPLKGLALGLGIALTVTLLVEVVRHLRRQRTIPAHC